MGNRYKHIQVRCYEPLAVDKSVTQGWSDVWLRWKGKPKEVYTAAPTLVGRYELHNDMYLAKQPTPSVEFVDGENGTELKFGPPVDMSTDTEELERLQRIDEYLNLYPFFLDESTSKRKSDLRTLPTIYTQTEWINRAHAEGMLAYWFSFAYGIRNPKFIWKKPKFIIQPTTFMNIEDRGPTFSEFPSYNRLKSNELPDSD